MGFDAEAVDLIARLVRWHLLLATTATTRDPDDPATVDLLTEHVRTPEALALLTALTQADAKATSAKAWSSWRAGLIRDLSRRTLSALERGSVPASITVDEIEIPAAARAGSHRDHHRRDGRRLAGHDGVRWTGSDCWPTAPPRSRSSGSRCARPGSGRRGTTAWRCGTWPTTTWTPGGCATCSTPSPLAGSIPRSGWRRAPTAPGTDLAPTVVVRPEASDQATVIEVRAADRLGVIYLVSAVLAELGMSVRSAHISTLGPQAVDVFYVQEPDGAALSAVRASGAATAIRDRLSPSETSEPPTA